LREISAGLRVPLSHRFLAFKRIINTFKMAFRDIRSYPSAMVGLGIIILLVIVSIYAVVTIPYQEAVDLWRPHNTSDTEITWEKTPKNAGPAWTNIFRRMKLPETIHLRIGDDGVEKTSQVIGEDMTEITIPFSFEYPYDGFPEEISLFFTGKFKEKKPHITLTWITPEGREIQLDSFALEKMTHYRLEQNEKLPRKLGGLEPTVGIFADSESQDPVAVKGTYTLEVSGIVFEAGGDIDCEFVLYGKLHGLAGTDNHRRDLMIALLWGAPVALAFGLLGAVGTSLVAMLISAVGAWYGGWVDSLIQRITEVNIILPTLPIAIMIFILYSRSIWTVLLVIVLLNIFGSSIKNYRAAFLQVRETAFIEGAIAYGASGPRIIRQYMIPRILPILLPQLVIMVPGFVFYEATLAFLGLSDPYLPTWGKVVHDALMNGAYTGYYYWILEPIGLLLITGLAFALLGFALDRVVNPRLRDL
jgi:peptide/nickel transport system permease protein